MTVTEMIEDIMKDVELGDHFWDDLAVITKGKILDRKDKVLAYIGETKMLNRIAAALQNMSEASVKIVSETATHYREKYGDNDDENQGNDVA